MGSNTNIEDAERDEGRDLVLSMRAKMCLGGLCFFLIMSSIAYVKTPYLVTSLQRLTQNETITPENKSKMEPRYILKDDLENFDSEDSNWFLWEEAQMT